MLSPTLGGCGCKNTLAHGRACKVPILVGGAKGGLATYPPDNLRPLFLKGEENHGVL